MSERKRCYYEVLGVEETATDRELTKAYRKQALILHPDKNHHRQEEAAEEFKEVQNAYAVLSDPDERAWYDSHKEQILSGNTDGNNAPDEVNLFDFASGACYRGYEDNEGGFYDTYRKLFENIVKEDGRYQKFTEKPPGFGSPDTPWPEVQQFYSFWQGYSTRKNFAWKDEYKPSDFPDRFQRRAAERHNDKIRGAARGEYNQTLRFVINFVKRRDPRVKAEQERLDKIREAKEAEREASQIANAKRMAAEAKKLQAQAALEEEEWARNAEEREAERLAQLEIMAETEAKRLAEEEAERQEEMELQQAKLAALKCEVCKKPFKTEKLMDEHVGSAKHKNKVKQMIAKGELPKGWRPGWPMDPNYVPEGADAADVETSEPTASPPASQPPASSKAESDSDDESPATMRPKGGKAKKGKAKGKPAPSDDEDDEPPAKTKGKAKGKKGKHVDSEDDEPAPAAAPAATMKPAKGKKGKKGKRGAVDDSDDDAGPSNSLAAEIEAVVETAQKDAKQKARDEKKAMREAGIRQQGKGKKGKNVIEATESDDSDGSSEDEAIGRTGGGFAALKKGGKRR